MFVKNCEFCKKQIITRYISKRFCNPTCQRRDYNSREDIIEKRRLNAKIYRINHPEWKIKHNFLELTKYRERRKKYWEEYGKRPEVRARIRENERLRRQIDPEYAITDRLRRSLHHALSKYSKTGKIMSSRKYGIDWKIIIESLKPFPENIKDYEIDHIIPLHSFDLTNSENIKKAFSSSNLQWLTREENRRKNGKLIIGNSYKGEISINNGG